MMVRKLIMIIILSCSGAFCLQAMDVAFLHKGLERVATTISAVGAGQMIEESSLPEKIKVPLFIGVFTGGTFGLDFMMPAPTITTTAKLLTVIKTGTALASSWYIIDKLTLSDRNKSAIMAALCCIHVWRICKAQQAHPHDK